MAPLGSLTFLSAKIHFANVRYWPKADMTVCGNTHVFFASNCSLSVRQLDVSLNSAEMRSFSSCVRGIHVSVVGCILTVWVTKGAAIAPRIAREIATFHCFMAKSSIRPKRLYNTLGKSGHRAPHGSFMLCAIFFGHSAVSSSIQSISLASRPRLSMRRDNP